MSGASGAAAARIVLAAPGVRVLVHSVGRRGGFDPSTVEIVWRNRITGEGSVS